jgi:hypothetical protein
MEISFHKFSIQIISKYREFIQQIRDASKSIGQASIANSIVLIPIAANAINELNNILNRLIRIAFTLEAEANYLRQPPAVPIPIDDKKELYQDKIEGSESTKTPHSSGLNLKRDKYSLLKQNDPRSNIRNQSAVSSSISNTNAFKLTSNMIANIFEDFFIDTNDLFN